jgi:hypothetical protein
VLEQLANLGIIKALTSCFDIIIIEAETLDQSAGISSVKVEANTYSGDSHSVLVHARSLSLSLSNHCLDVWAATA